MPSVDDVTTQTDAHPRRRLLVVGGIVLAAIVAVAVLIAVTSGGGNSGTKTSSGTASTAVNGASAAASEFKGIPQTGNVLGRSNAPATMVVFADMQCPYCAEFENGTMPTLVNRYVRPGKLKVVFQPVAILGNDSILGARAVAAAAQQNKMFDYAATMYRNQGQENTGYMTQDYVKKIAAATPGVDAAKLTADLDAPPVNKLLTEAQALATSGQVSSTPSFFVARTGRTLKPLEVSQLTAGAFTPELDRLTR
jgi:protein-disulfide isomerase